MMESVFLSLQACDWLVLESHCTKSVGHYHKLFEMQLKPFYQTIPLLHVSVPQHITIHLRVFPIPYCVCDEDVQDHGYCWCAYGQKEYK